MSEAMSIAAKVTEGRGRQLAVVGLAAMTYLAMYADGAGAASPVLGVGALDTGLAYMHEFFHHARHMGFACH